MIYLNWVDMYVIYLNWVMVPDKVIDGNEASFIDYPWSSIIMGNQ